MNTRINPEWRSAGNEWYRAIWIECAEMLDHYGWKWWKHQQPDMEQVILEIVDIWHFVLSDLLESGNAQQIADNLAEVFSHTPAKQEIPLAIESLARRTLDKKSADIESFIELLNAVELTLDDLYRGYIGKNVLNFFRQDHGYKQGTYQKLWNGKEDNEYLVEAAARLDVNSPDFQQDLYNELQQQYSGLTA